LSYSTESLFNLTGPEDERDLEILRVLKALEK
jgi:hypothetical protein